jgi:hypothetical protein
MTKETKINRIGIDQRWDDMQIEEDHEIRVRTNLDFMEPSGQESGQVAFRETLTLRLVLADRIFIRVLNLTDVCGKSRT